MSILRRIRHRLAHWLGLNKGRHITTSTGPLGTWIAFRCDGCGEVSDEHEAAFRGTR